MEHNASAKTTEKVKRWIAAKGSQERALVVLATADKELRAATDDLGEWLSPVDAKPREEFNIWYGSGILQAHLVDVMERRFSVAWRKEPDQRQVMEQGK